MSKKKIEKLQREYSKPQLTRWQRQKRRQKWTLIIGSIVILAVVVLVGTGYYLSQWAPMHATILDVNGKKYNMSNYISTLAALSESDPSTIDSNAGNVIPYLEQSEILKQSAAKLNITVTDAEVKSLMAKEKLAAGYEPIVRGQLLSQKLVQNYFTPQIPKTAEQRDVQAMLLESQSQANDISSKLSDSSFSDLAAQDSLDPYTKNNKGELGEHPKDVFPLATGLDSVPGDTAFTLDEGQVSQPVEDLNAQKSVGYWLIMVIEKGTGDNEGKVNFRVMLLGSEEEAQSIKDQLDAITDPTQRADKFTEIAKEKSQYKDASVDGGLLGMTAKGTMSKAFDAVAFNLGVGEISNPVRDDTQTTEGGYWLIKVTKIDKDKALTSSDINMLAQKKFSEWFSNESANYKDKVKETMSSNQMDWAVVKVNEELSSK